MLRSVWVIIGCLIGAGFASGKEILLFFHQFGKIGICGIVLASFLFFLVIQKSFAILDYNQKQNKKIRNYNEFLKELFPSRSGKISSYIICFINIFILLEFYIMVSGFGAYMKQEFQVPAFLGATLISICTYFTCKKSMKGIEKVSQFVIPLLIISIIHMGVKNVDNGMPNLENFGNTLPENMNHIKMIIYAILYASYNSILLIPVLIGLKNQNEEKNNLQIAILSAVFVAVLAMCIFRILSFGTIDDWNQDIPVVKIARRLWKMVPRNIWNYDRNFHIYYCNCNLF